MKKRYVACALLCALTVTGCSRKRSPVGDPPSGNPQTEVPFTKVVSQKVPVYIEATGTVQPDLDGGAKILAPVGGFVSGIFVKIGDAVRKNQPLLAIRSPEISDVYASFLATTAQVQQAERLFKLNEQLLEVGAATRNDVLNSEAACRQLQASAEGLKRKLDLFGVSSAGGLTDEMVLKSPIDGCAADIAVHLGDRFEPATSLAYVLCADRVVIVANLYDTDIRKIRNRQEVTFTTDVFPDTTFNGRVSYISGIEDPDAKTVKTYIRLAHDQDLLKQNMFLKIRILESEAILPVVAKTCLLYKDGRFFAFVRRNGALERRAVNLLREVSETQVAVDGLRDGDEVVTSAMDLEKT